MIFFIFIFAFIFLVLIWHLLTKKFINPYKLYFFFGKKGCGKSTLLSKIAYENLLAGYTVYSTEEFVFYHKDTEYKTKPINPHKIYEYKFPDHAVILIDEVSLIWDNRNFKNMDPKVVAWFRYQRHYKCVVYLFSQSFDIDKKLRDLTDDMYLVNKVGRIFTIARHMVRKPIVVHPSEESPARIDDDIVTDGLLLAPFGGMKIAYIPYWTKFFDSYKSLDS